MFTTYSHLKAEDNYRREVLRDQNQQGPRSRVGKAVTALVVAGAVALAACGTPGEAAPVPQIQSVNDSAPNWRPNDRMLDELLNPQLSMTGVASTEFGGMAAPVGAPDWKAAISLHAATHNSVGNSEPTGAPNYGLLETLVGAEPTYGPR